MSRSKTTFEIRLKIWKRHVLEWVAVRVFGGLILPLLLKSWRIEHDFPADLLREIQEGRQVIVAFWHNRQIGMLRIASLLHHPLKVMVSRHGDGEIIARIAARFGVGAVRGSSTRGGTAALRELTAAAREGHVAITPDGPVGPRYRIKRGVIATAAMSGLPVVWVSWAADRAWTFDSWDRFVLPKPFARIRYSGDGPLEVPTGADEGTVEAARHELENRMNALTADLERGMGNEVDPLLEQPAS